MNIPTPYMIRQFCTHTKRAVFKSQKNVYNAECPICKEGKSSGKKRRLFYFIKGNYLFCHNCNESWSALEWLTVVTNKTVAEVVADVRANENIVTIEDVNPLSLEKEDSIKETEAALLRDEGLPGECVDLFDAQQVLFYKNNTTVKAAIEYIQRRRIDQAINRPKHLYVCLDDFTHKNRLLIPCYDLSGKLISYQTRTLLQDDQRPKYLTKDGEKGIFLEDNIDFDYPYLFIFEGPIDAMFVKNGIAVGGASLSVLQKTKMISHEMCHKCIYVFDNDKDNADMKKRISSLISENKNIFFWPKQLNGIKDINELCMRLSKNSIPTKFFIENTYSGVTALTRHQNAS